MPHLPAFCDSCGAVFASGFVVENCSNLTLSGNKAGPCPRCGGSGSIPDGVFDITGSAIRLLSGPQATVSRLKQLEALLQTARTRQADSAALAAQIKADVPELASLASVLPANKADLYSFIQIILTIIGLLIAGAGLLKDDGLSEREVQDLVDKSIRAAIDESHGKPAEKRPHREGKRPGRNEKCPCESGKKYKKCCGLLV